MSLNSSNTYALMSRENAETGYAFVLISNSSDSFLLTSIVSSDSVAGFGRP